MAFITAETRSDIIALVVTMLNRAPDSALLDTLVTASTSGKSLAEVADMIAATAEFTAENSASQTAKEYATAALDRAFQGATVTADLRTAAIDLAVTYLNDGMTKAGLASVINDFLALPSTLANADFGNIAAAYANKNTVAEYYVLDADLGDQTVAELTAAIASVTDDAASVTTATAAADTTASTVTAVPGKTLTLTTGVDAVTAGAGNDTINGVLQVATQAAATGTTTSPGDVVNGGDGTDTFNLSVAGDAGGTFTLQAVQLNNVENLLVTNFDINAAATTIDTALMTGVTKVGLGASSATGDTVFTGMTAIKDAQMANGSADLTLTYSAGTTGTADVQNLAVSAVSAGSFSANGVETVAVTNSLTANKLTNITGSSLKAITVTGDQNFTMTGTSTVKGIDTSANTGKASLVLGAATHTVTTGAANDTIDIGANLSAADKIQGGEGTDTLKVETAGTLNGMASAADVTAEFAQTGGFENIEVAASGTATLNIKDIAGVETVTANTNIRTITIASVGNHSDADVWSFTINGTTYSAAAVVSGGGSAAADDAEAAAAIALKINNDVPGATATSALGVVTVVNTSGGRLDISAVDDSVATDNGTGTVNALAGLTVSGITTQSLDIYNAGSITARLADPSGDADVLNVNLKSALADRSAAQTIDTLNVADTIETINLNATGMKTGVSSVLKTITTLTSDTSLTTLNISGSDDLTIGTLTAGKLATIDASTATGNISLPGTTTLAQTITMGSGNDTLTMGGNLTGADVIDMGGNSAIAAAGTLGVDTVITTGNLGSTVASMVPNISNAEAVTITGTANYIDGSSLTNVGALAFTNTSGATTLTNMPAGTAIGLGIAGSESTHAYTVALADATGTADALTLVYGTAPDASTSNTIVVAGVETLNVVASKDSANNEVSTLVLTNAAVSTINVTGGEASDTTALGTLNKATTAVNAGSNKSIVSFDASTGIAMTVSAAAAVANVINLSTKADTVTLSGLLGTTRQDIDGGVTASAATADTLNVVLTSAASDFRSIGGFEVLNLSVPAALGVGFNATASDGGLNSASVVNILGGNSNSSFTVTTAEFDTSRSAATALTVDASTFGGNIDLQFASDALDIFTTVKGGALATDVVDTIIAAGASATVGNNPTMSGVETLTITSTNNDTDAVINLGKATGLTRVNATFVTTGQADQIEIDSLAAGVPVYVTGTNAGDNLDVGVAGSTGASDALTIVGLANATGLNLDAAGIETLTYSAQVAASSLDLAGVAPTLGSATTVNLTGPGAVTITALNTGTNVINAATLAGGLTVAASVRNTDAFTITGGVNNDSIAMENVADVLDGGTQAVGGADTLVVDYSAILGGITVDLSAADQVVTMDGTVNSASQSGFESVDVRAFANFGAVITGSDGANIITGTVLADRIDAGKGNDTIQVALTNDANNDQINGGAGTDTFTILAGNYVPAADGNLIAVETITSAVAGTITLGNQTEGFTITAGAGAQVINGGQGSDAIALGAAGDIDTIIMTGNATTSSDTVSGFIVALGEDELELDLSDLNARSGTMQQADATTLAAVASGTTVVTAVASAAVDFGAAASDLVTIAGAVAYTPATLETAIEGAGTAPGLTAGDSILIAYDDTANTYIALLTDNAGTANGSLFTDVTITNLLTLTGVVGAEALLTTSVAIIT